MIGKITFPMGAGGNHLRWLLLMSPSITLPFVDSADKIKFIKEKVYNSDRSWDTWLAFEWKYRNALDKIFGLSHEIYNWEKFNSKHLFISVTDFTKVTDYYFTVNMGMNNLTPGAFNESYILNWSDEMEVIKNALTVDRKIIDCSDLISAVLDKYFYLDIVKFFNLEPNYEDAAECHALYINAKKNASRKFYEYFTSSDFQQRLTRIKEQ